MRYTEDVLVQQTTADYLAQQLGWESVFAHNKEDFWPDRLLGCLSDLGVVLTHLLCSELVALNFGFPISLTINNLTFFVYAYNIAIQ